MRAERLIRSTTAASLGPLWNASLAGGGVPVRPAEPTIGGGQALFSAGEQVTALDLDDGHAIWRASVGVPLTGSPVRTGPLVAVPAVSAGNGVIKALDATAGTPVWSAGFDGPGGPGEPQVIGAFDRLFAKWGDDVAVYRRSDGRLRWRRTIDAASSPSVANGILYLATPRALEARRVSDGSLRWSAPLDVEPGGRPSAAAIFKFRAYVVAPTAGADGRLWAHAFDSRTGAPLWSGPLDGARCTSPCDAHISQPVADDTSLYAVAPDGRAVALERASGQVRWVRPGKAAPAGPPTIGRGVAFVTDAAGEITALSSATGTSLWSVGTGAPLAGSVALGGGHVVATTTSGVVRTFSVPVR